MADNVFQQYTNSVNELLNQPDVLHPSGHQFYWVNEQDAPDELWLICGSFIHDIHYALTTQHSSRLAKLEAQLNYGGVFIDGHPPHSAIIRLNEIAMSDEWLFQLQAAMTALYLHVSPWHLPHDLHDDYQLSTSVRSCTLALLINQIKAQLELPEFNWLLMPYAQGYDSARSEYGIWVSSISLFLSLQTLRRDVEQTLQGLPLQAKTLIGHIEKTQQTLKRLYTLTAPFFSVDDRIKKDFEFQPNLN